MKTKNTVLLVMPYHHHYFEYYWIPVNLIFLATTLKEAGYRVKIIDDRIKDRIETVTEIKKNLNDTICVGISSSTGNMLTNSLEIAKEIKKIDHNMPVIFGGSFSSAKPELTLTCPNIDYVITGRGEYDLVKLVSYINQDLNEIKHEKHPDIPADIKNINNLIYRNKEGEIIKTVSSKKQSIESMPDLCYFDESIINISKYISPETRAINYSTSTGCIGQCTFCYWEDSYKLSFFPPERVVNQLLQFKEKFQIKNISFDDPVFFYSRKRTLTITQLMIDSRLDVHWRANARVDLLKDYTQADFYQINKSGCDVIHIGLEHGSARILKLMGKDIDKVDAIRILIYCKNAHIKARFHILLGNPTETIDDLKETADFVTRLLDIDPDFDYTVSFFTPFPGNDMTIQAENFGYVPPNKLEDYGEINIFIYDYGDDTKTRRIQKPVNPWKMDFIIPWYGEKYSREYLKAFRKLIPEKITFESTNQERVIGYLEEKPSNT